MKKNLHNHNKNSPKEQVTGRRSMIGRSTAAIGALLLSSSFTPQKSNDTDNEGPLFDVTKYGATGKRENNATQPFRDAISACTLRNGGTVNVPPGEYTIGTIQLTDNVTLNIEAGADGIS